jgi:hydroxymethylpyrimidine/phosphomethylpyrimidine kinase
MRRKKVHIALTIAGSDSGGGAGIQADLKTFAFLGLHGVSVLTCITAQNPVQVIGIQPVSPKMIESQLEAVFSELKPDAVKTGMLYNQEIIHRISRFLQNKTNIPLIVDPVMISTSGARLLKPVATKILLDELIPLAHLVTPNLHEAQILLNRSIETINEARTAAQDIYKKFKCPVLLKGGHLSGLSQALDFFYDGSEELLLNAPFIKGISTHGTGCTYSAAIAGYCAKGFSMRKSVIQAKTWITRAIAQSFLAKNHFVLNHLQK